MSTLGVDHCVAPFALYPLSLVQKHEFVRIACRDCEPVKRGGRNSHDSYNKDFATFWDVVWLRRSRREKGCTPPCSICFSHKLRSFAQTVQFRNPPGCCLRKLDGKSGGENEGKRIMFKERNFLKFDTYTINN